MSNKQHWVVIQKVDTNLVVVFSSTNYHTADDKYKLLMIREERLNNKLPPDVFLMPWMWSRDPIVGKDVILSGRLDNEVIHSK